MAREISGRELHTTDFKARAKIILNNFPEIHSISWLDVQRKLQVGAGAITTVNRVPYEPSAKHGLVDIALGFNRARELNLPIYIQQSKTDLNPATLQLVVSLIEQGRFSGVVFAQYSMDEIFRYGVPPEISARYAVSLLDRVGTVLARTAITCNRHSNPLIPWAAFAQEYSMLISPVGDALWVRAQAYRTSLGVVGSGLF
jgi:hypothetical protein